MRSNLLCLYQQEVIDTTLSEFDRQAAIRRTAERDRAIQAGAYGGGEKVYLQQKLASRLEAQRAQLQAQLLAQGFAQAQQAAAADLAARQGLGTSNTIRSSRSSSTTSNFRCSSSSS